MVLPAVSIGGMEVLVLGLSRALIQRGHEVEILCTEGFGDLEARIRAEGVPLHLAPAPGLSTLLRPTQLADRIRSGRFDIVHSHGSVVAKASRAARMAGTPGIISTLHGFTQDWGSRHNVVSVLGYVQCDIVVGCSIDTTRYLQRSLPGLAARIHHVSNGIDLDAFARRSGAMPLRDALGIPATATVIGSVGRLDPIKNQQLMIEALRHLDDSVHLMLVGEGDERHALETRVAQHGLAGRVHLVGSKNVSIETYESFDVFALSSNSEAMPMTILEAFAARIPVVGSAVGGIPPLLHDGRSGLLFPAGDAEALARAIAVTLSDRTATAERVATAHAQLLRAHTLGAMTSAYESMYATALGHRRWFRRQAVVEAPVH